MKDRSQTIINVCLAIFVATTIYNINELNDTIDELNESTDMDYVQQRINKNQAEVDFNSADISGALRDIELLNDYTYSKASALEDTSDDVDDIESKIRDIESKIRDIADSTESNKRSIRGLPEPKTINDIRVIVNRCETDRTGFQNHTHDVICYDY